MQTDEIVSEIRLVQLIDYCYLNGFSSLQMWRVSTCALTESINTPYLSFKTRVLQ